MTAVTGFDLTDQAAADAAASQLLRRSYEDWALRRYFIKDKFERVHTLRLRPCQQRVGEAEAKMLRERGRARLYVLKGRQGGITTDQQARSLHAIWANRHKNCATIADTKDRADEIFEITRRAVNLAPPGTLPRMGQAHTREITFPESDCRYHVDTAGVPDKTAIGLTLSRLHCSEFAKWDAPKEALAAASPALEAPGTVIVLETTAAGFDSDGHKFWREARARGYEPIFIPWWECDPELYQSPLLEPDELGRLDDDETALVKVHGLTLEQIKWRRHKIVEMGGKNDFLQQYAEDDESCWLAAGGMYYDAAVLRVLIQRAPNAIESHMGGERLVYGKPRPGERVIIGADTAEGQGGDSSTYSARGFDSWRLLETFKSDRITPEDFADLLAQRGMAYGEALLIVEKNMHGITVLRRLRGELQYPVSAIYHREALDTQVAASSDRIGWATTKESKPIMLSAGRDLITAAVHGNASIPPLDALKDALGVRRDETGNFNLNGRDLLVAEMLAWIGRTAPMPSEGMFEAMRARVAAAAKAKGKP